MKNIIIGSVLGILSTLLGVSVAKADCSQNDTRGGLTASEMAAECEAGDSCASEGWDVAVIVAEDRCDYFIQGLIEDGYSEEVLGGASGVWEACIRLATPLGPLPAAQHYDTQDGTFWKVAGAL